ncbi:MAG: NAD(P)H-binding protein [Anaerolineales bacterium]
MSIQKTNFSVVTGAFGYSGKYITRKLLDCNQSVLTLTGHPERPNEFGGRIQALPFNFNQPESLANSLQGADTLYNTYWVRFDHGQQTFARAVANTKTLFQAAKSAGVGRIVHISITNPSTTSNLPYFRNKALLEAYLQQLGVPFGIVRPTVVFGKEDILINNIAYLLRHMPPRLALFFSKVFGVLLNDVLLTRDELSGLMNELLVSKDAPTGRTCFSRWVMEHGQSLGANYASELERHYKRG